MTIRLNKVTRDLNVGISTVVEFLQKKGFAVEANPNTKISEEQYALLVKEFSTDKNLRLESERFIQERQNKDRNKASVSIDGYEAETTEKAKVEEIKTVIPEDVRPKFKPVGKIDLDRLNNRKPVVEKVEEKKAEQSEPMPKEASQPQPESKPEPQLQPKAEQHSQPETQKEPQPEVKKESVTELQANSQPELQPKQVAQPETQNETASAVSQKVAREEQPKKATEEQPEKLRKHTIKKK